MKKLLLTGIGIFFLINAFSQAYIPFAKDGKEWTELSKSGIDTNNKSIVNYRMEGDTLIGIKQYKKVLSSNSYFNCYISEDTSLKKVYCQLSSDPPNNEFLLYDFNLQVGDTFYDCSMPVLNKTVEYFAGKNRTKLVLENPFVTMVWYEGIGSLRQGVFLPKCYVGSYKYLLCYLENDTLLYHNSVLNDSCFIITQVQKLQKDILFNTYYYDNILHILPSTINIYTLSIFDIFGRRVKEINTTGNIELNLSTLPKGLYLYRIKSKDINRYYNKLLLLN